MTKLTQGNKALRDKDYQQAIAFYIEALMANPELSKAIVPNITMAQQKFTLSREENKGKQRVAVCGWALSGNSERICTLAKLYESFAEVEIIGALFPESGSQVSESIGDLSMPVHSFVVDDEGLFLDYALKLVLAHPFDGVHLSKPRIPNVFIGLLYKLVWNAKVLIDINEKLTVPRIDSAISIDKYIKENDIKFKILSASDLTHLSIELNKIIMLNLRLQQYNRKEVICDNLLFKSISKNSFLVLDAVIGKNITGWALYNGKNNQRININLANYNLGFFIAQYPRLDIEQTHDFNTNKLGYNGDIGGILQFVALSKEKPKIGLNLAINPLIYVNVNIQNCISEAITFTPMRLIVKIRKDLFSYYCNKARVIKKNTLELNFIQIASDSISENYVIQLYQTVKGKLKQIISKNISSNVELVSLKTTLVTIQDPILIIVKMKSTNELIFTDCIPYPILLHTAHELMIELHSLYVNRQQHIHVNSRLQKHWLDYQTKQTYPECFLNQKQSPPNKTTTAIVFYSREPDALIDADLIPAWQNLAEKAYFFKRYQGLIAIENLNSEDTQGNIKSFSELNTAYVLFWDISAVIRPDYWSILKAYCDQPSHYQAISGNSIIYDGEFVPSYIGHKPLTNFSNSSFDFLPLTTVLVQKTVLNSLNFESKDNKYLLPENIVAAFKEDDICHLRIPIDVKKESPLLIGEKRMLATTIGNSKNVSKMKFLKEPTKNSKQLGFSVIINFRNVPEITNKALSALKIQQYSGNIEVILVNNCSHISAQQMVSAHAISLFGEEWVKIVDYPHPFNHSEQTNIAVEKATQPLLLMLSNDAFLLSSHCLQQAEEVLKNPQVATCGFQIVRLGGKKGTDFNIESVGLQFALGQLCTLGGQLLKRNIPLNRHANKIMRVAGNTFAAVAIQTEFFKQVGEMDIDRFPTTYNDVEFCLRASGEGFYHVVASDCIVQHSGRGTREPDLDFPTNPEILASIKNINELADSYSVYNFGGLRVF